MPGLLAQGRRPSENNLVAAQIFQSHLNLNRKFGKHESFLSECEFREAMLMCHRHPSKPCIGHHHPWLNFFSK